jgi:hypothetical protein
VDRNSAALAPDRRQRIAIRPGPIEERSDHHQLCAAADHGFGVSNATLQRVTVIVRGLKDRADESICLVAGPTPERSVERRSR